MGTSAKPDIRETRHNPDKADTEEKEMTAHRDLSILCDLNLLHQEGKGRATHYVPKNP